MMAKITETDYETVEKEVERYKCDHCEMVYDKADVNLVQIFNGSGPEKKEKHLCDACTNVREAFEVEEKRASVKERWESFGKIASASPTVFVTGLALASGSMWFAGLVTVEDASTAGVVLAEAFSATVLVAVCMLIWVILVAFYQEFYP